MKKVVLSSDYKVYEDGKYVVLKAGHEIACENEASVERWLRRGAKLVAESPKQVAKPLSQEPEKSKKSDKSEKAEKPESK